MAKRKYAVSYNPILEYWKKIEQGEIPVSSKIRRWYQYLADRVHNPTK